MVLRVNERRVQTVLRIHVRVQVEIPHGPRYATHDVTHPTPGFVASALALNIPIDDELGLGGSRVR